MLTGSMISKENRARLRLARVILDYLKNSKLFARYEKYKNAPWELNRIVAHLEEEVKEFKEAPGFLEKCLELADISNCIDAIMMLIMSDQELINKGDTDA